MGDVRRNREATREELVELIHRETQAQAGAHRRKAEYREALADGLEAIERLGGRVTGIMVEVEE